MGGGGGVAFLCSDECICFADSAIITHVVPESAEVSSCGFWNISRAHQYHNVMIPSGAQGRARAAVYSMSQNLPLITISFMHLLCLDDA